MAVYSHIENNEISKFLHNYEIGSLIKVEGILEGIENTNYKITTSKNKYILTIFEKRVKKKDLPFFMDLMFGLSKLKIKCPEPIKDKKGKYLFKIKKKKCMSSKFPQRKRQERA